MREYKTKKILYFTKVYFNMSTDDYRRIITNDDRHREYILDTKSNELLGGGKIKVNDNGLLTRAKRDGFVLIPDKVLMIWDDEPMYYK